MKNVLIEYIKNNKHKDTRKLALQSDKDIDKDLKNKALAQIRLKQKSKSKLPLFYEFDELLFPGELSYEQSSSELTAEFKSTLVEGDTLLDMTGGLGVDSIFFSKKGLKVDYLEKDKIVCDTFKKNIKVLKVALKIKNEIAEKYIKTIRHYDVIYADPDRRKENNKKVHAPEKLSPNVIEMFGEIISKCDTFLLKLSPFTDIAYLRKLFPKKFDLFVVSVDNECKELLLRFNDNSNYAKYAVSLSEGNKQIISVNSISVKIEYSKPLAFLYEPNSSLMKIQEFNFFTVDFGVKKLSEHTHLFTSDKLVENFPGKTYKIETIYEYTSSMIKNLKGKLTGNAKTKNFPNTTDEITKKLKIKAGTDILLFTTALAKKYILILKRIN